MKYIYATLLYLFSEIALACYCEPPSASDAYSRSVEVLYVEVTNVEFMERDFLLRVHYVVLETFKTDGSTFQYVS